MKLPELREGRKNRWMTERFDGRMWLHLGFLFLCASTVMVYADHAVVEGASCGNCPDKPCESNGPPSIIPPISMCVNVTCPYGGNPFTLCGFVISEARECDGGQFESVDVCPEYGP